jgi:hypothetical protein
MADESPPVTNGSRLMPSRSTVFGTGGGVALAPILIWIFGLFTDVQMPPEIAAGIGALIGNVIGYFFEGGRKV